MGHEERIVSPYFRSHLLVSEANVSDVLFLGFYSDQWGFVLKRSAAPSQRSGTGQAEPDWPAQQTGMFFCSPKTADVSWRISSYVL